MSKRSIARQAASNRAFAFSPTTTKKPKRLSSVDRLKLERGEAIRILGVDPSETPNHYETLAPSDPTQRDVRHLAVELIMQRDGPKCYLCKKTLTPRKACLEHIIPLVHGGENTATNIALACYRCNFRKASFYVSLSVPSGTPCYHQPRT